ncbi:MULTISPECIES: TadE/TadG family type IV pilus assembly protein, partial [Bordetella]
MFVVFFVVLYGGLTWAFIFAAQQSLNHAAEEGARAALQWPGSTALEPRAAR